MKPREPEGEPGRDDPFDVGAYSKVGLIGQGGYGVVIEAIHRLSQQVVALKFVDVPDREDSVKRQRVLRGTRLLARLSRHSNVVPI